MVGIPYAEAWVDEENKPHGRQCMRCNFVRYSQEVLNRIDANRLT